MTRHAPPWTLPEDEIRDLGLVPFVDDRHGVAGLLAPAYGGELASLCVRWQDRWVETLYRAAQYRTKPPFWRGRAPLLWPTVGRSFVDEDIRRLKASGQDSRMGSYRTGGQLFAMPTHGFAMNKPWQPQSLAGAPAGTVGLFTLQDDAETRTQYPFAFRLTVAYTTGPWGVRATYTVQAGDNPAPMPFTIGNHISLLMPAAGKGRFGDVMFYSPAGAYRGLEHPSIFDGRVIPMHLDSVPLAESAILNMVSCGYRWDAAEVTLWCPESFGFTVVQRILDVPGGVASVDPDDTCFFVFWGDPKEGYFCPEPWLGGPNALNTGRGLVRLQNGQRFVWQMEVRPIFSPPEPYTHGNQR